MKTVTIYYSYVSIFTLCFFFFFMSFSLITKAIAFSFPFFGFHLQIAAFHLDLAPKITKVFQHTMLFCIF